MSRKNNLFKFHRRTSAVWFSFTPGRLHRDLRFFPRPEYLSMS